MRHCNREFLLRDKQAGFRQDGWRDETVEREGQHSCGAALFKHYQNSIFTVYTNRLTSIQLKGKQMYISFCVSFRYTYSGRNKYTSREIHFTTTPLAAYCHQRCFSFTRQSSEVWHVCTRGVIGHIPATTQQMKQCPKRGAHSSEITG